MATSRRAVILAAALLLAGAWLARSLAPGARALPAPATAVANQGPMPRAGPAPALRLPEQQLASALRRALDLRAGLEILRARCNPDDPLLAALTEEVRTACAIARRPDAVSARVEYDPNRTRWVDDLMRRCSGLRDADLAPPEPSPQATELRNLQLPLVLAARGQPKAALELARGHVGSSVDAILLVESLRYLLDTRALPLDAIFAGVPQPPRTDIDNALIAAADWIACARSAACGSDGVWTLYLCAQFGCPPGTDLPRALYRTLPPQQFEIAQRIVRWALRPTP